MLSCLSAYPGLPPGNACGSSMKVQLNCLQGYAWIPLTLDVREDLGDV